MSDSSSGHPQDRLSAYLDDALDVASRTEVDRHLAACPACRSELASLRRIARGIAEEAAPPVPADLADRIARKLDEASVVPIRKRGLAIPMTIAATLMAVGLLAIVQWRDSGTVAPPPPRLEAAKPQSKTEPAPQAPPVLADQRGALKEKARSDTPAPPAARESKAIDALEKDAAKTAPEPATPPPVEAEAEGGEAGFARNEAAAPRAATAPSAAPSAAASRRAKLDESDHGLVVGGIASAPCGERWTDSGSVATWDVDDAPAAGSALEALARESGGRAERLDPASDVLWSVVVPPSAWTTFAREATERGVRGIDAGASAGALGCIRQRVELRPR